MTLTTVKAVTYYHDPGECPEPRPRDWYSDYGDHMWRDYQCPGHRAEEVTP